MKTYYLIHETTKEHVLCKPGKPLQCIGYKTVEADPEGWIKHTGDECPLPDDAPCLIRFKSDHESGRTDGTHWHWDIGTITHYRPILTEQAEPVKEPDYDPRSVSFNLIDRLKAAHQSAQQIPDIEAELRRELAGMGYTLGMMSPFVESANSTAVVAEPEAAVETTQDKVIAGALFDFLAFLTTRDKPTSFGATRNASPAVKLLQEWANKRGLDLVGADVEGWCHGAGE